MENIDESPDFDPSIAELLEAISHPIRVKILQTLNEKTMGVDELGKAVGIDSERQLSFHLTKLGHLVMATTDGGYALTGEGKEALWSIQSLSEGKKGGTSNGT